MTGALVRLAMFYKGWGRYEQAVPYYVRAVQMKEVRTSFDPRLLTDLESLSDLLRQLNRTDEAKKYDARRRELIDQQISREAQSATK